MVTKFAVVGWFQTMKFFSSQNHIDNFVVIFLGRFSINKTQNWRFWTTFSVLVKIFTFSTLTPPKTLISGPKKKSRPNFMENPKINSVFVHEDLEKWRSRILEKTTLNLFLIINNNTSICFNWSKIILGYL
jgi:hypothetical protein